jgi:DNA-binding MarR family transcriptional regulator
MDTLCAAGLALRIRDPKSDGRAVMLALTADGEALLATLEAVE